ncbi:hypothetical protein CgunFtcFv8_003455 [Champsocephalus gunnari]|uniref:Uncharacterized protein n=1 Tax=Champsocephalus gunnari TaxID=52237 RepID=A0AAN8DIX3_CHAGU|nr:hypothetical protein CgunFtcFv8_003455 [Champsocephalus gunnari]
MYQYRRQKPMSCTCSLGRMLVLAACLQLALLYPAGSEGMGVHPAVFIPAQGFPWGQTAAADPRSRPGHRCSTLVMCGG